LPQPELHRIDGELAAVTARPPEAILAHGSGWGALERRRLAFSKEEDRIPPELVFDEASLGADQAPWLALLQTGSLPDCDPIADPGQWMVQSEWEDLLRRGLSAGRGGHWLTWLHLGNMRLEARDAAGAKAAWTKSLEHHRTAWALRNLSVVASRGKQGDEAVRLLLEAWHAGPQTAALAIECARMLLQEKRHEALCDFAKRLPQEIRQHERIELLNATAVLRLGQFREIEGLFRREFATIQEGEVSLTDLWFSMHEQRIVAAEGVPIGDSLKKRVRKLCPPPPAIDFRLSSDSV
jgi:hypothetical protein